jgi:adenylate cyclase
VKAKAERRVVGVLYAELRNFTRLSEVLEADRVLELANEFFALAGRHLAGASGRVIAVHNDSILALFTAAADALVAAQAVQREFPAVGERWRTGFGFPAAVALGVHVGSTVLGMAGPAGQEQFVALGDAVSIAERLVHRARPGEIVLSQSFLEALGIDAEAVGAQALAPLELPRRPRLPVYGVLLDTGLDFTGR